MMATITLGDLSIDRDKYDIRVRGERVALTYLEFELLFLLVSRASRVLSREEICTALWGTGADGGDRLTVHVSRLRKKIRGSRWMIQTVKKRGYGLTAR